MIKAYIKIAKKAKLIQLLMSTVLFYLIACSSHAATSQFDQGLFWKISKQGIPSSYILGTAHLSDARVLAVAEQPRIKAAFDKSRRFVMEVVLDSSANSKSANMMLNKNGKTLKRMLPRSLYKKTIAVLEAKGIPEIMANNLKIWAAAVTLLAPDNQSELVLDTYLLNKAYATKKKIDDLESVEEQLKIFDRLLMSQQTRLLEQSLESLDKKEALIDQLIENYLKEDLQALVKLSTEDYKTSDARLTQHLMHELIDKRNKKMVRNMEYMLRQGRAFIAIGALHLPGEVGVLNLLVKNGYQVEVVNE